jgi:signal transduction histidine kinase/ligand-binding sensor domain-containing protein
MSHAPPGCFASAVRRWFPALWFCVAATIATAQTNATHTEWSVRTWQTDDGLPNNSVTSVAQTSDGYLWVATFGHFARFDGVRFEEFTSKNIAPNLSAGARVGTLLEDSKSNLWLATVRGPVVRLNHGVAQIFTNDAKLPIYSPQAMVEDGEGGIWITYHGDAVCRIKDGVVTRFTPQDGLPERYDCTLARDNQGRIWFAKNGQAGLFRHGRFETLISTVGRDVRLARARAGGIWLCSGRELFKVDDSGTLQSMGTFKSNTPGTDPTALLEDKNGAVWIGTATSGLFRYSNGEFENVPTSHPFITGLLEDHEGNLWVGTGGGGLDRIHPRAFALESEKTGSPAGTAQSICEDAAGAIWVVYQNGLLACQTNGNWRVISDQTNWPGIRATCVTTGPDDAVWVGTKNHALIRLRPGQFTAWRGTDGFIGHVVCGLLAEDNGDLWVVEEDPNVVQRLRAGNWKTFALPPASGVPRALCQDAEKNLWIGTSKGYLLRIQNEVISDETTNVSGMASPIRSLATSPDGSLWIGYAGWGLGRFKDNHFTRISTGQGLFNDFISQIIFDGRGWLWFGSDRGIFKARLRELNDYAEDRAARVLSIDYGEANGLPSLQASFGVSPNVLLDRHDRLWFPTLTALAVVSLDNLLENLRPPPVVLKQVVVDDQLIGAYGGILPVAPAADLSDPQTRLRLPPGHRHLQFDFTALSFNAPGNAHFQYRLDGFDDGWIDAGTQRSVSYSRLPAGNYQFQVRAENSDGAWSAVRAVRLSVLPFFWQTWWFRLAALALFTLLIIAVVRFVLSRRFQAELRALEKQAALDKERSRIAKDIHDDLGGSLTQIKLLFELTQRHRAAPDKVESFGQEGLAATRQIIKSMDEIVWAVNPRNDSLPSLIEYLGQFAIEFLARAGIRCRVDLPDHPVAWAVSPEARHNLFLVVKEALNNVIRHAGATEVWLRIAATETVLTILIEDNGHGFENKAADEFADGLPNMNQRMAEIGGRAHVESVANQGTRISLNFPKPH